MIAHCLDLSGHVNAVGATFDTERPAGAFNAWGNSFPAEELPFGRRTVVGGVPYELVAKAPGRPDHVEVLGQHLATGPFHGLALLAAGEMGPQELSVRVGNDVCSVIVPGWTVRPETVAAADQLRCSHQHYPGDYGLAHLLPVLHSQVIRAPGATVELLANPLVHVFAVTLLAEVGR